MKKPKEEILYGVHPVLETIRAGRRTVFEIYTTPSRRGARLSAVMQLAEENHIPLTRLKEDRLASLTGHSRHQGIAARVSAYPFAALDTLDFTVCGDSSQDPFLLLLDSVVDPHNFGALIRTALCVGMNAVLIPKDRAVAPTPAVSKASAGALEHMAVIRVTNMVKTMEALKARGLWLAGMSAGGGDSLFETDLKGPLGLLIGGEEKGLRPLVQRHCDLLLSIPQSGPLDSLNASVAGAVVMYEAFRQRQRTLETRP